MIHEYKNEVSACDSQQLLNSSHNKLDLSFDIGNLSGVLLGLLLKKSLLRRDET